MREPCTDDTIEALIARPPEAITARDIPMLQESLVASAAFLQEAGFYEQAIRWGSDDPHAAHAAVLARDLLGKEPAFPELRHATLTYLTKRMDRLDGKPSTDVRDLYAEVQSEAASNSLLDRARAAEFRADPGRWLPGAYRSTATLLRPNGCWLAERDGETMLCLHADVRDPVGAQDAVVAAYKRACREGYWRVIVVGAPGLAEALRMPTEHELAMCQVDIECVEFEMTVRPRPGTGSAPIGGRRS